MTKTVFLGDIVKIKGGKRLPKGDTLQLARNLHPYLRIVDMGEKTIKKTNMQYVPEEVFPKISRYITNTNDVLLSIVGTIGLVAVVDEKLDNASLTENCVKLTCNLERVDPDFLYYFLRSSIGQDEIWAGRVGSSQPKLPLYNIAKIKVPDLTVKIQKKIAVILSSLDEKIELNRKMNETLEQMGQALFRHYFVDNVETEGWDISTIGKECDVMLGGTPSRVKPEYWENGTVGWINSGKVNEFRIIEPSELITDDAIKKSAAKIMPTGTTVLAITGATLGQVSRIEKPFAANQSVIGILGNKKVTNEFMYFWINENIKKIIGQQTGGAQQHINRNNIVEYELLMPPSEIVQEFQEKILLIMNSIAVKCFEIQTLTTLRDTLLPRLMNGKLKL